MSATGVPRRKSQRERVEQSTERLLQAAMELFGEQGYAATNASQIGERAGYSRAMVNVRYGSKKHLLEFILRQRYERRVLAGVNRSNLTGLQRGLGIIDELRGLLDEDPTFLRAVLMLNFEALHGAVELGPHVGRWLSEAEHSLAACLAAGQGDGSVDSTLDVEAESRHWAAAAIGLSYRWCSEPITFDFAEALCELQTRMRRSCAAASA